MPWNHYNLHWYFLVGPIHCTLYNFLAASSPFSENVPGLKDRPVNLYLGSTLTMLLKLGYRFHYFNLTAQQFGLPQKRDRVFIIAARPDVPLLGKILLQCRY